MGLETMSNPILSSIRLMQSTHLRRNAYPASLQCASLSVSFLRVSVALHLDILAQPLKGLN